MKSSVNFSLSSELNFCLESKMISILVEDRFRYVILFVGCLCLTSIASNMLAFNIAQVCMGSNDTVEMENKVDVSR